MIKITVEMYPKGREKNKRTLGTCKIVNDCTGTKEMGNYNITFFGDDGFSETVRVEKFPRLRFGVWDLLHQALGKTVLTRWMKDGDTPPENFIG